jgi:hypothetical protein
MLPVGFYDPETSSLTLMEEDKWKVFGYLANVAQTNSWRTSVFCLYIVGAIYTYL